MIKFNKPKFIRKSDFVHYFNRPKDQWFINDSELEKYIKQQTKFDNYEDEDENYEEDIKFDPLEYLRQLKESGEDKTIKVNEDAKMVEGINIDKKSREFIHYKFRNLKTYDMDELFIENRDLNFRANETQKILQKDNFVVFQPVFIYKNKAVAIADALVKENGKYYLIETKGTSKPKLCHLVDIIYQQHIINHVLSQYDDYIEDYYLCVVKYAKGSARSIDLDWTKHIYLSPKGGKDWSKKEEEAYINHQRYSDEAIKFRAKKRLGDDYEVTIKDVIENKVDGLDNKGSKVFNNYIINLLSEQCFEKIIDELTNYVPNNEPKLLPDIEHFKCWFKDYDFLKEIRTYYAQNPNYPSFCWSGYIFDLKKQYEAYQQKFSNTNQLNHYLINLNPNVSRFFDDYNDPSHTKFAYGTYKTQETKSLFSKLKPKKVYFDFETINPATRVLDDTVPYTQVVTQVSIIVDNNECNNIVIDPLHIGITDLIKVVDSIYQGEEYSYIVYNKNFECTRLREIASYINKTEYDKKINTIINNIFDLADFFDPRKDLITINELHGFYSIKAVLPFIEKHAKKIYDECQCKDYHGLHNVQNGQDALNRTSLRFFNLISDDQWEQFTHDLKIYCENDVRAMIAVEKYINFILSDK